MQVNYFVRRGTWFACVAAVFLVYVAYSFFGQDSGMPGPHCIRRHVTKVDFPTSVNLKDRHVDVVLLLDKINKGVANLMTSIFANTNSDVTVHVGVCGEMTVETLRSYLACYTIHNFDHHKNLRVFTLNDEWQQEAPFEQFSALPREERGDLVTCGNYMRFFLPRLLPDVQRVVYLDTDMIVQGDVAELDYYAQHSNKTLGVTKRLNFFQILRALFPPEVKHEYDAHFKGPVFDLAQPAFCAGMFLADLNRWRGIYNETIRKIQFWISVAKKHSSIKDLMQWWVRPSQGLMQLVFNGDYSWIPDRNWQSEGLGWQVDVCDIDLVQAKILHWNGGSKPWSSDAYRAYWSAHTPLQCQGRGQCSKHEKLYTCDYQLPINGSQKLPGFATHNYNPFSITNQRQQT